ncbi:MAG TPA: glycerophosphodiester phosphodiesterase family protein, partial [Pseudomonadales bacterium]|nr:glycerophosphodiester phosphodiesterase family protein [Pseudomonadales bacterium]
TAAGLTAIAGYADGVGPQKSHFILAADAEGRLDPARACGFIDEAHAAGLLVHPYTFRAENHFLPPALRGSSTEGLGDLVAELRLFLALGIDGFFCDQPDLGRRAIDLIE